MRGVDPKLYHQGDHAADPLRLTWLGTAGFTVTTPDRTLVLDPFVTRPSLMTTAFSRLVPNEELVRQLIPEAHDVLIGHAHHDHILDAPSVCLQTGARLIGSAATCNVGRAAGVPEAQLVETHGDEDIPCGPRVTVRGIPSAHGRAYFNRVPLPGDITEPPPWPPRFRDLRHGLVFNWYLSADLGGRPLRMMHIDSAEFFADAFRGLEVDVLCLCAIGRRYRPRYTEEAIELLRPKYVVPCHWDWFFSPYHAPPKQLPGVDLEGFIEEIRTAGAEPVLLPVGGTFGLTAEDCTPERPATPAREPEPA